MKKILSITAVLLCATFASCNKDAADDTAQGAVTFSFGVESDGADNTTRAGLTMDELKNTAVIKIYKGDFSGMVREYVNSDKPETIYLQAGNYRVDVEAGQIIQQNPALASWDYRSFRGSKEFTVNANETTSVAVTAKICNVVTDISFDQSVDNAFEDNYTLTIGLSQTDPAQQLQYSANNQTRRGYFIADGFEPSLYWTFSGTLLDGTPFNKSDVIPAVEQGKCYRMNLKYTEKNGKLEFSLTVDKTTEDHEDEIIFVPVSTGLAKSSIYEIWAGHATVHADVDEDTYDTENVRFEYRKAGSQTEWISVTAKREDEGVYSQTLTGLTPSTEYEYRLMAKENGADSAGQVGESMTFTTEKALTVPNMGFETGKTGAESTKYYSFFDPASSIIENQTKWWDSGNKGSTVVGTNTICDPDTQDYKEGTQSAYLHSEWVVIKLAAGNLFSGEFADLVGTKGGKVNFGRPFTGRPTALRLWVKYSTDKVNRVEGNPEKDPLTKDDYDRAQIKIALGTWNYRTYGGTPSCPVQVNTTDTSTFVDFEKDPSTIAYGNKVLQGDASNSTNVWQQITIPLDYRNENTYPTHIIISCAASMLGDYFTGCDKSKLWLDGMELLYE